MSYPVVRNIIFDFGGVICNIDISLTENAFRELGMKAFDHSYSITERENFFASFETGLLTPEQFREKLRKLFDKPVSDNEIDRAWNALLLDIPASRIQLLLRLRKKYRLFLLSNTNLIHFEKYRQDIETVHGYHSFDLLFDKAYFSFRMGLRKPFHEVFEYVIKDSELNRQETLFIDDSLQHIKAAQETGLVAYHLQPEEEIISLFNAQLDFLPLL